MGLTSEPELQAIRQLHDAGSLAADRPQKWTAERVLSIHYWTPNLLSIRTTRHRGFRFMPGHYARVGLAGADGSVVWRPYSIASAAYEEALEFMAVLVPGGAFSTLLEKLRVGDSLMIEKASYGFLTVDQLAPGKDLWLLATGTGLGPFLSILRDPAVWQAFERLIVVHSVRHAPELAYRDEIAALPHGDLFAGATAQLSYFPIVTRDPGATALSARIPQLLADGRLEKFARAPLSVSSSRLMFCGNPGMARDSRRLLSAQGFATNRRGVAGQMVFEGYW